MQSRGIGAQGAVIHFLVKRRPQASKAVGVQKLGKATLVLPFECQRLQRQISRSCVIPI